MVLIASHKKWKTHQETEVFTRESGLHSRNTCSVAGNLGFIFNSTVLLCHELISNRQTSIV